MHWLTSILWFVTATFNFIAATVGDFNLTLFLLACTNIGLGCVYIHIARMV